VPYTGYNPVLNPVFLARNRTVTRVVAKQAKTTKVKNKFAMEKKSSKKYSVVFLVEGEKFNLGEKKLGDKVRAKRSNLPCRFCCEIGRHTV